MRNSNAAGSLPSSKPVFLVVGLLRRPHGVKGEIIMDILTDFPERLKKGILVYVGPDYLPLKLSSCRQHGQALLVSFEGYQTPEQVGELRNLFASVPAADRPPLPAGEYYHHQILGLQAVTEAGVVLGVVHEILETGANDVFVIQPATGPEILLPDIDTVVKEIQLEKGQMIIALLPGLLPDG
jgi:16S rRNA processing protein RimM